MYAPEINQYSWVNLANVLWLEQPVGTGFSIGDVTATSEDDIAKDFTDFFLNFEKTFGIKNFKIYVTGESYGSYFGFFFSSFLYLLKRCKHVAVPEHDCHGLHFVLLSLKPAKKFNADSLKSGRYIPFISAAMLDRKEKDYFDVSGRSPLNARDFWF